MRDDECPTIFAMIDDGSHIIQQLFATPSVSVSSHHVRRQSTHQLYQLDNARSCFEVSNVESDLQRLRVGTCVCHHSDIGLGGGLGPRVGLRDHDLKNQSEV